MAAAVGSLGDRDWKASAELIADRDAATLEGPPTYRDLALAGVALVVGLARAERWSECADQAERLARYFATARRRLDAVVVEAFAGLAGAARARDPETLADFADLVLEVMGA